MHTHQLSVVVLSKLEHEAFLQSKCPRDDSTKQAWKFYIATLIVYAVRNTAASFCIL